jgi:hypothetical protein
MDNKKKKDEFLQLKKLRKQVENRGHQKDDP